MTVAFFDLDNTLIKGSSLFYFAKFLVKHEIITKKELAKFAAANAKFISTRTEDSKIQDEVKNRALELVTGKTQLNILELCDSALTETLFDALNSEVLQFLYWHQERGHSTWIVTASPVEIATGIAKKLNMTGALGTISEVINGKYTGKLLSGILHGKAKSDAIRAMADYLSINLENSYAYSDSINDLPLLCTVGTSIVVNPNKELSRIAKKNNWKILETNKRNMTA